MGSRRLRRLQEQAEALRKEVTKSQDVLNGDSPTSLRYTDAPSPTKKVLLDEDDRPRLPSDLDSKRSESDAFPLRKDSEDSAKVRAMPPHNSQVLSRPDPVSPKNNVSPVTTAALSVTSNATAEQRIAELQAADERNRFQMEALMSLLKSKESEIQNVAEENARLKQKLHDAQAAETKATAQVAKLRAEMQMHKTEAASSQNLSLKDTHIQDLLESQLSQERRAVEKLQSELLVERSAAEELRKQQSGDDPMSVHLESRIAKLQEELAIEQKKNEEIRDAQAADSKQWQRRIEQITAEEWTKLTRLETQFLEERRKSEELQKRLTAELAQGKQLREELAAERVQNTANASTNQQDTPIGMKLQKDPSDYISSVVTPVQTVVAASPATTVSPTPVSLVAGTASPAPTDVQVEVRCVPPPTWQPQITGTSSPATPLDSIPKIQPPKSASSIPMRVSPPRTPLTPTAPPRSPGPWQPPQTAPALWQTQPIPAGIGRMGAITPPRTPPAPPGSRFLCDPQIQDPRPGQPALWQTQPVPYHMMSQSLLPSQPQRQTLGGTYSPMLPPRSVTPPVRREITAASEAGDDSKAPRQNSGNSVKTSETNSTGLNKELADRTMGRVPSAQTLQRPPGPIVRQSLPGGTLPPGYPGAQLIATPVPQIRPRTPILASRPG